MFPELANEELLSDMDANKLLLQNGDTSESDDEDFNPLEEGEEDDNRQRANGKGGKLGDDKGTVNIDTGNYKHDLFFYPGEEMDSNINVRYRGGQDGRQQRNSDTMGCFVTQHSISEGVEMSERNKGSVEQSVGVEGENNDLKKHGCTTLFEVETAAADVEKESEDTDLSSDSSMIVDSIQAARELDELSDGFSEDDPARHNKMRLRMRSSKMDHDSEMETTMILGVSSIVCKGVDDPPPLFLFIRVNDYSLFRWRILGNISAT